MKKTALLMAMMLTMAVSGASAKDIRIVEISTGSGMSSSYDSSIQSILKTLSGVSKVVSDVTNLVLTVTYDADEVGVDDIVKYINKEEPRFEAKQKSEPKTKEWVKAEKKQKEAEEKINKEREEVNKRDAERESNKNKDNGDKKDNKGGKK